SADGAPPHVAVFPCRTSLPRTIFSAPHSQQHNHTTCRCLSRPTGQCAVSRLNFKLVISTMGGIYALHEFAQRAMKACFPAKMFYPGLVGNFRSTAGTPGLGVSLDKTSTCGYPRPSGLYVTLIVEHLHRVYLVNTF